MLLLIKVQVYLCPHSASLAGTGAAAPGASGEGCPGHKPFGTRQGKSCPVGSLGKPCSPGERRICLLQHWNQVSANGRELLGYSTAHYKPCPQFAFSPREKHVALLVRVCVSGKCFHADKRRSRERGPGFCFCEVWGENPTYFSSFILHIISSFQFTKIMATSFSVTSSDSISGFWKIWGVRRGCLECTG